MNRKMKQYVIYFKWLDDGMEDSFIVTGYKELVLNLLDMKNRKVHTLLSVCEISKYGEYIGYKVPAKYQF